MSDGIHRVIAEALPDAPDADQYQIPTLAERWRMGLLKEALNPDKPLIRLEEAGLGSWIDRTLGGGLEPGNVVGLVSAGAGVGKTAFVHQMADGLAARSALALEGAAGSDGVRPQVTPVLFVTEMKAGDLTLRTLARASEQPGWLLRAPRSKAASQFPRNSTKTIGEIAIEAARGAAEAFMPAAEFLTPLDRTAQIGRGAEGMRDLQRHAQHIRETWERRGAEVLAVVVMVDPLHRLLDPSLEETAGLGEALGELLSATQSEGLVTLYTSDTTKAAVKGEGAALKQQAELAFRGSYQLVHIPDFAFALRSFDPEDESQAEQMRGKGAQLYFSERERIGRPEWATVYADLVSPKLRWGKVGDLPAFWYDRALFRFEPIPAPQESTGW